MGEGHGVDDLTPCCVWDLHVGMWKLQEARPCTCVEGASRPRAPAPSSTVALISFSLTLSHTHTSIYTCTCTSRCPRRTLSVLSPVAACICTTGQEKPSSRFSTPAAHASWYALRSVCHRKRCSKKGQSGRIDILDHRLYTR